jgi:dipeptidyl-peptidase-3
VSLIIFSLPVTFLDLYCLSTDDEIRQNEGFKNVTLGNVVVANDESKGREILPFVCATDAKLIREFGCAALDVKVALHELLGHGSGKLFFRESKLFFKEFNFSTDLKNPLTGEKISSWYEAGESYDSKFGALNSPYEECRADTVAYHLSSIDQVFE